MVNDLDFSVSVRIRPCYPHVIWVNKQRSFKDITIVKDIYDQMYGDGTSFHNFFLKENSSWYERRPKRVFANCWLDESYFDCEYVSSKEQIDSCHDGILYLHDLELLFDSRASLKRSAMDELIDLVNNAGKNHLQIRASGHRRMSIDVKLRSLVTLWVETFPSYDGKEEGVDMLLENFVVFTKVYNCDLEPIGNVVFKDLNGVCGLYDTDEKVKLLN